MIFQLIYVSSVLPDPSTIGVFSEIAAYRVKNARLGITGLLLVNQGAFMQVLEGEEAAVRKLYATIRADPRHEHVHTLATLKLSGREFPDWAMGFADLDEKGINLVVAEQPFLDLPAHAEQASWQRSIAKGLLATFMREP